MTSYKDKKSLVKNDGQVFTPSYIVTNMLDFCGYKGPSILGKHVIDNSCGNGAFLCEILKRYIQQAQEANLSETKIKEHLSKYIHGIDLEDKAYQDCLVNLSDIANENGISNVQWDIVHGDALQVDRFNHKMDFVVGNPPYVRVHNLSDSYSSVKKYSFAEGGMTDLYLVFFEIGFNMLASNGVLCYITPSSWLSSVAGTNMRSYIRKENNLEAVIDLEHYQPFNATAYTLISLFREGRHSNTFDYYVYDGSNNTNTFIDSVEYSDSDISGCFYLAKKPALSELKKIKCNKYPRRAVVKNGFATLADKVFIGDVPESSITINVIKGSTGKWYKGLFPYDKTGKPIPETILFSEPQIKQHFFAHKEELTKGNPNCVGWYYYGRTQAINDVRKDKFSINTIIKDINSVKLNLVKSGEGIYSGLYILTDVDEKTLRSILSTNEFVSYISMLKNYKSGGYYTFNSKDLEQYLNYKLSELYYDEASTTIPDEQSGFLEGYLELF